MNVASSLEGVTIRYSRKSDVPGLVVLMRSANICEDGFPKTQVFSISSVDDFIYTIETSLVCLTAFSSIKTDMIVGFIAINDSPGNQKVPNRWPDVLLGGAYANCDVEHLSKPYNSLWLQTLIAPPTTTLLTGVSKALDPVGFEKETNMDRLSYTSHRLAHELLRVALGACPSTEYLLSVIPSTCSFKIIEDLGQAIQPLPSLSHSGRKKAGASSALSPPKFDGNLYVISRQSEIPKLSLRIGRIQDYDDFVPLLVNGRGVVTTVPKDFYLEEQLKEQDEYHKIVIAENPVTHEVVGMACLRALDDTQEVLSKRYMTEMYGKLRTLGISDEVTNAKRFNDNRKIGNTFMIDFLYFNPDYNKCVHDFLPFMFQQFPMCEYASIILPHHLEEPPFLSDFLYMPVQNYQPHNFLGESISVPDGLWVSCRYSLDPLEVDPVTTLEQQNTIEFFLEAPMYELSSDTIERIREDLYSYMEMNSKRRPSLLPGQSVLTISAFSLKWNNEVVGVATARRLTVRDMYALRHNYALDEYVYYYPRTHKNYEVTDFTLTPVQGKEKFFCAELPGAIIRAMYITPQFQHGVSFFVREILRFFNAEMAIVLGTMKEKPFKALVSECFSVRPRRVLESPAENKIEELYSSSFSASGPKNSTTVSDMLLSRQSLGNSIGSSSVHASQSSENQGNANVASTESFHNSSPIMSSFVGSSRVSAMVDSYRLGKKSAFLDKDPAALGALFFATRRSLGNKKKRVNTRIAVVGAGVTGLSFLHRLLTVPYIHFTNLTLVSTDGLPLHQNQVELMWFADNMELLEREYLLLVVGTPLRVIAATMIDLDKVNKFIALDNHMFEPYDYLILTCGRQYISPLSVRLLQQQEGRPFRAGMLPMTGEAAVTELQTVLQEIDANASNTDNILVYGSELDAFATVAAIIRSGFSSQRIVLCSRSISNPFVDESCYTAVGTLLKSLGTSVMRGFDVCRLEYDDDNKLTTVMLAPVTAENNFDSGAMVELRCCLMVCMEDKDIDPNILSTLNKRSIVFDGRVIVENNYRTTDPFVFAAGPVAMFTRRYGATQNFDDFKARDIGSHLGEVVLGFLGFDEFFDVRYHSGNEFSLGIHADGVTSSLYTKLLEENGSTLSSTLAHSGKGDEVETQKALKELHHIPTYVSPLARRLRFSGGFQFFCAYRVNFNPSECIKLDCSNLDFNSFYAALEASQEKDPDGLKEDDERKLSVVDEQNYIAIYINSVQRTIDGVTYFGNGKPEVHNYYALIGYPETILNLLFRYDEAMELVKKRGQMNFPGTGHLTAGALNGKLNIMEYLRLPHLQTVFYDKFTSFFEELREKMKTQEEAVKMRATILENHGVNLTPSEAKKYQNDLTKMKSNYRYEVQLELIRFLHENKDFRLQNLYLPSLEKQMAKKLPDLREFRIFEKD